MGRLNDYGMAFRQMQKFLFQRSFVPEVYITAMRPIW